jgi:dipeptidyl aminopeptidase/acylaminoacyl peptidase
MEGGGGFSIAPDAKELAFTENPDAEPAISTSAQIYTLNLMDAAAKPVKVSTSAGGNFNPAYSPDGKYLAWRSQARAGYESDKFRLMVLERVSKSAGQQVSGAAPRDLLPKFDNWVDEFVWGPDSRRIYFTSETKGASPVMLADLDGEISTFFSLSTLGDIHPLSDNQTVLGTWSGAARPGEIISLSTAATSPREEKDLKRIGDHAAKVLHSSGPITTVHFNQITNLNGRLLAQLDLSGVEDFWFTAEDGTKVQGFIIRPPGFDAAKKYPVKFLIHGGPQGAWGDMWSYRWNAELFAANGYVVVMINPRGSTGYGQAFVDGVNGDWGGKPFTDLMTGLDYAEQHYNFIDKTRECALGASYGGYMANWVLGHTNRFKCIVSHDGMFDAESAFGSTEEDWFNIWEFKGHPWDYYGKPDAENPFRKWSPSLYATHFKTPTLVVHSQLDYRLDVSEGFQLFDTLQLLKVPSKMLYFPDEGHWVLKPQNSQLWYKTVNDWVDEWTKSRD